MATEGVEKSPFAGVKNLANICTILALAESWIVLANILSLTVWEYIHSFSHIVAL